MQAVQSSCKLVEVAQVSEFLVKILTLLIFHYSPNKIFHRYVPKEIHCTHLQATAYLGNNFYSSDELN